MRATSLVPPLLGLCISAQSEAMRSHWMRAKCKGSSSSSIVFSFSMAGLDKLSNQWTKASSAHWIAGSRHSSRKARAKLSESHLSVA